MWISLQRLSQCDPQPHFLVHIPGWFYIQTLILIHLDPREGHQLLRSCVLLYIDKKELFLTATAIKLDYSASNFSVPTPPLQPFIRLELAGQGGGV